MKFESLAEQRAYGFISLIACALDCEMEYQKKFYLKHSNHETYRVDFTLESPKFKIIIEIDGKAYHDRNSVYEIQRDLDLQKLGYLVVHIPAKEIFLQKIDCLLRILTAVQVDKTLVRR